METVTAQKGGILVVWITHLGRSLVLPECGGGLAVWCVGERNGSSGRLRGGLCLPVWWDGDSTCLTSPRAGGHRRCRHLSVSAPGDVGTYAWQLASLLGRGSRKIQLPV